MRTMVLASICILFAFVSVGCVQKHVLLVTQYPEGTARVDSIAEALKKNIRAENVTFRLSVFNMDTLSHPTPLWREGRADVAVVHANAFRPDLTVVAGDDAARYFAQRLVNTNKRIIFLDVKGGPAEYGFVGASNVTGVRDEVQVRETFALMKELAPSARTVGVVADTSLEGDAVAAAIQNAADLPLNVVAVKRARTLPEWMAAVKGFQGSADILCIGSYGSVARDAAGNEAVPAAELLAMTAAENRLPDCSFREEAVGAKGVLAAVTVPIAEQAELAARMAVKILYYSARIGRLPIATSSKSTRTISPERAAQLGVRLPAEVPSPAAGEQKEPK